MLRKYQLKSWQHGSLFAEQTWKREHLMYIYLDQTTNEVTLWPRKDFGLWWKLSFDVKDDKYMTHLQRVISISYNKRVRSIYEQLDSSILLVQ